MWAGLYAVTSPEIHFHMSAMKFAVEEKVSLQMKDKHNFFKGFLR